MLVSRTPQLARSPRFAQAAFFAPFKSIAFTGQSLTVSHGLTMRQAAAAIKMLDRRT